MRHSDKVISRVKISVLILRLNLLLSSKHWRRLCAFALILLAFLHVPRTGWAEENYFQIINGTRDAVSDDFIRDPGYSVFVSYDDQKFLFDVGEKKKSFLGNLKAAGITLDEVDFVMLSHRHSDHTRGWSFLRKAQPSLPIYVPPGAGFSHIAEPKEVDGHLKITPNIFIIHTHDEMGSLEVTDELSLLIKTKKGPYLFTTNSHTDFITKLEKAKSILGEGVFFHSGHTARRVTPDSEILATAKKMKNLNVKQISPSHSSPNHDKIFERVFGAGYVPAILGKKVPLEPVP